MLSKLPVDAFRQLITIAVEAGDSEQVLFCRVYNPISGQVVYALYPENMNWQEVTQPAIARINQAHS